MAVATAVVATEAGMVVVAMVAVVEEVVVAPAVRLREPHKRR